MFEAIDFNFVNFGTRISRLEYYVPKIDSSGYREEVSVMDHLKYIYVDVTRACAPI